MTIPRYGKLTSSQIMVLNLAGYKVTCCPGFNRKWLSMKEKKQLMCYGRSELMKLTKKDFGFSLLKWHNYLKKKDESDQYSEFGRFGYNHPYGCFVTRWKLFLALFNLRRIFLVKQLE